MHGERRCFFIVKRAQPAVAAAFSFELHILADYFADIVFFNNFVDLLLRNHALRTFPEISNTAATFCLRCIIRRKTKKSFLFLSAISKQILRTPHEHDVCLIIDQPQRPNHFTFRN